MAYQPTPPGIQAATLRILKLACLILLLIAAQLQSANAQWTTNGNDVYKTNTAGNVGIGTTTPTRQLSVGNQLAGFDIYQSGTVAGDSLKAVGNNLYGSNFGSQNTNPLGFSGMEYIDNNGNVAVFAGYRNGGTGEFRFNNIAANGHVIFMTGWQPRLTVANNGNIGLGTTSPSERLHVVDNARITGNLTVDGNISAKYQDLAEWVETSQKLASGTVVVLDHNQCNQVVASSRAYDTRVAGVISEQPGIALGESAPNRVLVATTGRVRIKVDATSSPIRIGDLLVTSNIPGVAMKSRPVNVGDVQLHRPGTLLGKALEPLPRGRGTILILLSLQ